MSDDEARALSLNSLSHPPKDQELDSNPLTKITLGELVSPLKKLQQLSGTKQTNQE